MKSHPLWDVAAPPLSYVFDGYRFDATNLRFSSDENGAIWTHGSGLQARVQVRTFEGFAAVE